MHQKIVIIDYGSGNLRSVANALGVVAGNENVIISNNYLDLKSATHLVLPGVGSFSDCIFGLESIFGLIDAIKKEVFIEKKPFLGICVGMQVLASIGNEGKLTNGLNFIGGEVVRLKLDKGLKIPHMGWNNIRLRLKNHPILKDLKDNDHFYFANSYQFICNDEENILADSAYGNNAINAIIAKDNIVAIQFHPEKSAAAGLQILKNFINS